MRTNMLDVTDIEQLQFTTEMQIFDRKSVKIEAKALAIHIIASANADGGHIAIGIEDNGTITGIDGCEAHINELLRAPFDYCVPSVSVDTSILNCQDSTGRNQRCRYPSLRQEPTTVLSTCACTLHPL